MMLERGGSGRNTHTAPDGPTVFLIVSNASDREALDRVVRSAGWRAQTVASAEELLAGPRVLSPSCLLTELRLPGLFGLDLQRLIHKRAEMPIVFMGDDVDVRVAVQAMRGGAFEVLTKPIATDLVLTTISRAIACSRAALKRSLQIQALRERHASLSSREREVMKFVVCGLLNKQVGRELGICEITVKVHRRKVMQKMQANSLAELVSMATSLRLGTVIMISESRNGRAHRLPRPERSTFETWTLESLPG